MLTDLSFIQTGKPWRPEDADEKARLDEHGKNRKLYDEFHDEIFEKYRAYLSDKQDDDKKVVIIFGWAETATDSYLNLLLGEEPDIKAPTVYSRPDDEVFTDASRYGWGMYEITQDGIVAQNPENCYIVTAPGNRRIVLAYVFFQEFEQENSEKKKIKYVKFTIHGPGYIQHLVYEINKAKLGDLKALADFPQFSGLKVDKDGKQWPFGAESKDFCIVRIDNKLTSDRYYGQSDYSRAVHSLIENLELAFARRAEVLAKFTRPKPMAGLGAFTFDHSRQKYVWKTEDAVIVEPGEPPAQYLTWQAQLEDVQKEIDGLMEQLLVKLKLSKVLLAGKDTGQADNATALLIRLIPSLSKVRKFASEFKKAVPIVLSLKSKLDVSLKMPDAQAFEPSDVQIKVKDGIPSNPFETAQWVSTAYVGGFMSLETAVSLTQGFDMDSQELEDEVARIKAGKQQNAQQAPAPPQIQLPPMPGEMNGQPTQ